MVSYLDNIYTKTNFVTGKDICKGLLVCFLDVLFFRPYLMCVGFKSYFSSKKVAGKWVSPNRVKVETTDD